MTLQDSLPILNVIAIVAVGVAIFYNSFRSGAKTINSEVMENYKELDRQQKDHITALSLEITKIKEEMRVIEKKFITEIATLNGKLIEKDRQLSSFQVIADPKLQELLSEIRDFMKGLHKESQGQTTMLEKAEKRGQHQVEMIESQVAREDGSLLKNK